MKCISLILAVIFGCGLFFLPPSVYANTQDKKLLKALESYYKDDFSTALSIFKDMAKEKETVDMVFWIGMSAAKTGDYPLAIEKLKTVLAKNPDLPRVRLELAIILFKAGQYDDARQEFEHIKSLSPPETILRTIDRYLAMMGRKAEKFMWNLRFTQAYQYDSNVNSGPDTHLIGDINRPEPAHLTDKQTELSSSNWLTDLRTGFLYDIGNPSHFYWKGNLDLYYSHSFEDSDFDYMRTDISTGPWWMGSQTIVKFPLGVSHKHYGGESLSNLFHFDPDIEYFFTDSFSMKAGYSLIMEDYSHETYSDAGYDHSSHLLSLGPNFYFKERKHILSTMLAYEHHDADEERQSFTGFNFSLSYFSKFETNTELLLLYRLTDKEYDEASKLYDEERHDTRNTFAAIVGQNFLEHYFASLELSYITNTSNADLYDYDKTTCTFSLGLKF